MPFASSHETVFKLRVNYQADEIMEKIYSNMSACHLKQGNWRRAIETADKVTLLSGFASTPS